jgi:hypothetical protein
MRLPNPLSEAEEEGLAEAGVVEGEPPSMGEEVGLAPPSRVEVTLLPSKIEVI